MLLFMVWVLFVWIILVSVMMDGCLKSLVSCKEILNFFLICEKIWMLIREFFFRLKKLFWIFNLLLLSSFFWILISFDFIGLCGLMMVVILLDIGFILESCCWLSFLLLLSGIDVRWSSCVGIMYFGNCLCVNWCNLKFVIELLFDV